MGRWEPDSAGRLREAAIALYGERGFESTTVAEIAQRAGVTERTFFRHFADKREVLFGGSDVLQDALVNAIAQAPPSASTMAALQAGLEAIGALLPEREVARRRQAIITANPELQERELIKLAALSSAMAAALRRRGLGEPAASLTGELGVAVFRGTFERWTHPENTRDFAEIVRESLDELTAVVAGG